MLKHSLVVTYLSAIALLATATTLHAEPAEHAPAAKASIDLYPLPTDAATGEPLGDKPVVVQHEGRELRFTNETNAEAFRAEPERYLTKLDERIAADQRPLYPLDKCIVSGEGLSAMGESVEVVVGNRLIRLCCDDCRESVEKDPAAIIAKLDAAAIEKQKGDYPLAVCPASELPLGDMGEPAEIVVGGRLVRLCCNGCLDDVRKKPAAMIAQVDAARAGKTPAPAPAPSPEHGHGHGHGHEHGHGEGHGM